MCVRCDIVISLSRHGFFSCSAVHDDDDDDDGGGSDVGKG